MHILETYIIRVRGSLEEKDFNLASPVQATIRTARGTRTTFSVHTDQAGLIGLVRFLHRQGFLVLSVVRLQRISTAATGKDV